MGQLCNLVPCGGVGRESRRGLIRWLSRKRSIKKREEKWKKEASLERVGEN